MTMNSHFYGTFLCVFAQWFATFFLLSGCRIVEWLMTHWHGEHWCLVILVATCYFFCVTIDSVFWFSFAEIDNISQTYQTDLINRFFSNDPMESAHFIYYFTILIINSRFIQICRDEANVLTHIKPNENRNNWIWMNVPQHELVSFYLFFFSFFPTMFLFFLLLIVYQKYYS